MSRCPWRRFPTIPMSTTLTRSLFLLMQTQGIVFTFLLEGRLLSPKCPQILSYQHQTQRTVLSDGTRILQGFVSIQPQSILFKINVLCSFHRDSQQVNLSSPPKCTFVNMLTNGQKTKETQRGSVSKKRCQSLEKVNLCVCILSFMLDTCVLVYMPVYMYDCSITRLLQTHSHL